MVVAALSPADAQSVINTMQSPALFNPPGSSGGNPFTSPPVGQGTSLAGGPQGMQSGNYAATQTNGPGQSGTSQSNQQTVTSTEERQRSSNQASAFSSTTIVVDCGMGMPADFDISQCNN